MISDNSKPNNEVPIWREEVKNLPLIDCPKLRSMDPISDAVHKMRHLVDPCVLIEDDSYPIGILTGRDLVQKIILSHKSYTDPVISVMSKPVYYCQSTDTLAELIAIMNQRRVCHVPVYDGKELMGLASIQSVLEVIVNQAPDLIYNLPPRAQFAKEVFGG